MCRGGGKIVARGKSEIGSRFNKDETLVLANGGSRIRKGVVARAIIDDNDLNVGKCLADEFPLARC